jgi:hypothetical protein
MQQPDAQIGFQRAQAPGGRQGGNPESARCGRHASSLTGLDEDGETCRVHIDTF